MSRARNDAFSAFWSICVKSVPCSSSSLYLSFRMGPCMGDLERSTCEQRIEHVSKEFCRRNLSFLIERFQKVAKEAQNSAFESGRSKSSNFSDKIPLKRALGPLFTRRPLVGMAANIPGGLIDSIFHHHSTSGCASYPRPDFEGSRGIPQGPVPGTDTIGCVPGLDGSGPCVSLSKHPVGSAPTGKLQTDTDLKPPLPKFH
jgi:hypothetical protein